MLPSKFKSFLIFVILAFAVRPAFSATVKAEIVGTYASNSGEPLQSFVERVGSVLWQWTEKTKREACGPILRFPSGLYAVQLTTEHAQTVCIIATEPPPGFTGATLIGESIHSHPLAKSGFVQLDKQDWLVSRTIGDPSRVGVHSVAAEPCRFSPADIAAGPGYLVACGNLWHQSGPGTATMLGPIAKAL